MEKICSKCLQTKDISLFRTYRKRDRPSVYTIALCKPCDNKRAQKVRDKNPDKEKVRRRRKKIREKYGLSWETYQKMILEQNNLCKICGKEEQSQVLSVDHCHGTGKIRGLLCNGCNIGLGGFRDSVTSLEQAIKYLKENT